MAEHAVTSRAALGILGTRAGIYPVKIVVTLLVAPLLGTTNYGIYAFLILPGSVLLPLLLFGLATAIRFYVSKGEWEAADIGFTAFTLGIVHGLFAALVTAALWKLGWLGETGRSIPLSILLPVLCVLPVVGAGLTMNVVMVGASWFTAMNLIIVVNQLLPPLLLAALVLFGGMGLQGAVLTIVLAGTATGLTAIGMVFVRYRPRIGIKLRMVAMLYGYGLRAWIGSLAQQTSGRLDQFVLGFARAPGDLGIYRIAVMVAELVWMIPDAVNLPLFNRVSRTVGLEERLTVIGRSHRVLLIVVTLTGIALFVVGWWLLPLILGQEYESVSWLLGILIPGTVALVTSRVLNMFFSATGHPEKTSIVEVVGALFSVGAYLLLIPAFGIAGAAAGTSMVYIVIALTAHRMLKSTIAPAKVSLFRARREDLRWAVQLIRDSFEIWGQGVRSRRSN